MSHPGITAEKPTASDPTAMGRMPNSPFPGAHDHENGPPPPPETKAGRAKATTIRNSSAMAVAAIATEIRRSTRPASRFPRLRQDAAFLMTAYFLSSGM